MKFRAMIPVYVYEKPGAGKIVRVLNQYAEFEASDRRQDRKGRMWARLPDGIAPGGWPPGGWASEEFLKEIDEGG